MLPVGNRGGGTAAAVEGLSAVKPNRSKIPASSAEIEAFPCGSVRHRTSDQITLDEVERIVT